MADLSKRVEREIEDLHRFFCDWLSGRGPNDDHALARLSSVLRPEFTMVAPSGVFSSRDDLVRTLRVAYGSRGAAGLRIWVEKFSACELADAVLATYEEWQDVGGVVRGRLSSAVLVAQGDTPHGVAWLRVHETWLPEAKRAIPRKRKK